MLAALWLGCTPPVPDQPNVLLITLDTTRADHLASYGYPRRTTPNLDALAARAYRFTDAWAPMATTLPSHTSLLTGTWPLEHGVLGNVAHGGRRTLPSDALRPVTELFHDRGYVTAAFVSATPLATGTGVERGFDTFDDAGRNVRHAHRTTEAAAGWLRKNAKKPFLLWVHYYDPHGPFAPPEEYLTYRDDETAKGWRAARGIPDAAVRSGGADLDPVAAHQAYDGELTFVDTELDRLLALLDKKRVSDRTVIVVVADHGEGLGQHGVGGHGQVWREQLQVPLLVYVPWERGTVVDRPISMVDVWPTVLGRLGWTEAWTASGRDVFTGPSGPVLGTTSLRQEALIGTPPQRALTAGSLRYLDLGDGAPRLYDLRSDPHEQTDLSRALPVHTRVLARWTDAVYAAQQARGEALGTGATVDVPAEERAALEALGYVE
ncbi:MAG: sulfatase [Myxococcota bacterium]